MTANIYRHKFQSRPPRLINNFIISSHIGRFLKLFHWYTRFGHDPALHVSARLSSVLLSSAPHVSAPVGGGDAEACDAELSNATDERDMFSISDEDVYIIVVLGWVSLIETLSIADGLQLLPECGQGRCSSHWHWRIWRLYKLYVYGITAYCGLLHACERWFSMPWLLHTLLGTLFIANEDLST